MKLDICKSDERHPDWAPADVRRWITRWLGGFGLGLAAVSYGVYGLVSGRVILPADSQLGGADLEVSGAAAVALSIAYIAAGVLVHVHWFRDGYPRLALPGEAAKVAALLVLSGGLGFAVYRIRAAGGANPVTEPRP